MFQVFGRKTYILKDNRNGKLDAKSDKGIFLRYSTKRKAYKCLNSNINKIVESENVRVDEFVEKSEEECKKEPKDYRQFVFIYEGEPISIPKWKGGHWALVANHCQGFAIEFYRELGYKS